ncbi:hypothetical protein N7450_008647 [Penicillium hetheringtonii]|uniref:CCHC-type domain-containing protein n=1 Tax=Penicillium hetheringtonii TaxID=911720 RepID=A0AAD6DF91_9EURO|nr:hypothetical protein N7450_008647 [Penicillium hetheringtonii]
MPDSGDEADSRTATVGAPRTGKKAASRNAHDSDSRPTKKQRRNQPAADLAVEDFVPRGGSFSEKPLEVDPDDTSSSGSGSDSESDSDSNPTTVNPHAGSTAPAVSWNRGTKNAVRTTLGKRKPQSQSQSKPQTSPQLAQSNATSAQFDAVNEKYWRSRSDSASSAGSDVAKKDEAPENEDSSSEEGEMDSPSDSDDSESLDSEADDSIMLNIGTKHEQAADDYDPEVLELDSGLANGNTNGDTHGISNRKRSDSLLDPKSSLAESKEEAFQIFSRRYPTAPVTLVDLSKSDLEKQAKFLYWDLEIHTLDLQLPIGCVECLRQGHMAEVCPTKECENCGAWNKHSSSLCPTWRRCLRCRERGHQEEQCSSALKCPASEVPCDLCGKPHLETQCDQRCAFPTREIVDASCEVGMSCARCASGQHLIGDCPSVIYPSYSSSTFSLKDIDPTTIINLSAGPIPRKMGPAAKAGPPPNRPPKGPNRGGRRGGGGGNGGKSFSSDSSDDMPRGGKKPPPLSRGRGRGAIRFGGGLGSDQPRGKPPPKRTISPLPRRGPPPPPRGGGGGGGGNRGRGGGRGGKRGRGR